MLKVFNLFSVQKDQTLLFLLVIGGLLIGLNNLTMAACDQVMPLNQSADSLSFILDFFLLNSFFMLLVLPLVVVSFLALYQFFFTKFFSNYLVNLYYNLKWMGIFYLTLYLGLLFCFFTKVNLNQKTDFGSKNFEILDVEYLYDWSLPFKWIFYIDTLGLLFLGLSILLVILCLIFLIPTAGLEKNLILYLSQLILLLTQLQLTFSAANLLTFFIAFESLLIPMIIMISVWGSPNRRQANNYLVFYTMISAVPMLLSIIYMSQKYQTADINLLHQVSSWSTTESFWLWLAFFFAFAVKTPMVPVHIWLPKAHVDAPTVGSVILAGVLLKIGLIGFIRILLSILSEATHHLSSYVACFATMGVLYASFITLRQIDMKRIIAYSSVAHMNMAVVSLTSLNPVGLYSTIYLMLSHGFIASGLFFLVGFLYSRFHVRTVAYFGGLATIMPVMSIMFFLFTLANMAFPFTSGFIGEFLLLLSIGSTNFSLGVANACSMLLTTVYCLSLFGRVYLGQLKPHFENLIMVANPHEETESKTTSLFYQRFSIYDMYYYEFGIVGVLLFFIFFLGCYPQFLLHYLIQSPYLFLTILQF